MNLDLTEEQQMLEEMARDFFEKEFPKTLVREMEDDPAGYRPQVWEKMAELGWIGLVIPERYGGAVGTTRDHDVGLYYRRARQAALLFGDSDSCREVVAQEMGL